MTVIRTRTGVLRDLRTPGPGVRSTVSSLRFLLLALLLAGLLLAACGGEPVMPVWDLRDSHTVDDVDWPNDLTAFEVTSDDGLEQILLPGGVEVTGEFRAGPFRPTADAEEFDTLSITFARESVEEVVARAEGYADQVGIDMAPIREWAADNADGQDTSPGGALSTSANPETVDGAGFAISTRAVPEGDALMRLQVSWRD